MPRHEVSPPVDSDDADIAAAAAASLFPQNLQLSFQPSNAYSLPSPSMSSTCPPDSPLSSAHSDFSNKHLSMQVSLPVMPASSSFMKQEEKLPSRTIVLLDNERNRSEGEFPSNIIRTSKYTALSFIPVNLFEQFRRVANVYFLVVILISLIPDVAPFEWWTSALPLIFILGISAAKDGYEDYMRHQEDRAANARHFNAVRDGNLKKVASGDIEVGDVLQIHEGQEFPSDLILLATSKHDGTCYVTTSSLDGEVTPKLRVSPRLIPHNTSPLDTPGHMQAMKGAVVQSTPVCKQLDGFEGVLDLSHSAIRSGSAESNLPLGDRQVLLRGAKLISTELVYAVVFATGPETKLMLNRNPVRFKFSSFERVLNQCVVASLILELTICLLMAVSAQYETIIWRELDFVISSAYLFSDFGTHFVLFSFMIPVSLFVTIDFVKIGQAKLIEWDVSMSVVKDTDPDEDASLSRKDGQEKGMSTLDRDFAHVKSSNLTDELGQVEFVFSDKTGTLTRNKMELSQLSVDGMILTNSCLPLTEKSSGKRRQDSQDSKESPLNSHLNVLYRLVDWCFPPDTHHEQELYFDKHNMSGSSSAACDFLYCLLVCNDVLTEVSVNALHGLRYVSTSPDEIALVDAMARNGVILESSGPSQPWLVRVERTGASLTFRRIAELEFSSDRRRLTVVVEAPDGRYRVFTKGASSTIERMLANDKRNSAVIHRTNSHLRHFAKQGSRTLMMASRELSLAELDEFLMRVKEAQLTLVQREQAVERAFKSIECDMQLVGCTAVEDQLQEDVPETIEQLLRAGISVIMLTGDMQETAITIGRSSRVISPQSKLMMLEGGSSHYISYQLDHYIEKSSPHSSKASPPDDAKPSGPQHKPSRKTQEDSVYLKADFDEARQQADNAKQPLAMVLNGNTLELAVTAFPNKFLLLFCRCQTVICNRATPAQKAMVVALVKAHLERVCLAIGDGANDVSMIRKAHVGIGLTGKEGRQAAQSGDFVLHRFHHLRQLLLVHGRYSYLRSSRVVLFSFYKNFFYSLPFFWFAFFSSFSGQALYDSIIMTMFNMFFSNWPPLIIGILEKDVIEASLLQHPEAFLALRQSKPFSLFKFVCWLFIGVYQSLVLYFVAHFWFSGSEVEASDGLTLGLWSFGAWIGTSAILVANATFTLMTLNQAGYTIVGSLIGPVTYIAFFAFYTSTMKSVGPDVYGISNNFFLNPSSYLYQFIVFTLAMTPLPICNFLRRRFFPTYPDVLRQECPLAVMGTSADSVAALCAAATPGSVQCCQTKHLIQKPEELELKEERSLSRSTSHFRHVRNRTMTRIKKPRQNSNPLSAIDDRSQVETQ